ncbi:methyltransferase, partial [Aliarcobacter butzleri]
AQTNKINASLFKGSYKNFDFDNKFDICISNPPFYHCAVIKSENESLKIARYNESLPLDIFIEKTSKTLKNDG